MSERKNYLNTDEIQTEDEPSLRRTEEAGRAYTRQSEEAIPEGSDESQRINLPPPTATTE
jgi:hypothetical protein